MDENILCSKKFPNTAKVNIARRLNKKDMVNLCLSGKESCYKNFCDNEKLWKYLINEKYGFEIPAFTIPYNFYYDGCSIFWYRPGMYLSQLNGFSNVIDICISTNNIYVIDTYNRLFCYKYDYNIHRKEGNINYDSPKITQKVSDNVIKMEEDGSSLIYLNKNHQLFKINHNNLSNKQILNNVDNFYMSSDDNKNFYVLDMNGNLYISDFSYIHNINFIETESGLLKFNEDFKYFDHYITSQGYQTSIVLYNDDDLYMSHSNETVYISNNVKIAVGLDHNVCYVKKDEPKKIIISDGHKHNEYQLKNNIIDIKSLNVFTLLEDQEESICILLLIDEKRKLYILDKSEPKFWFLSDKFDNHSHDNFYLISQYVQNFHYNENNLILLNRS